MCFPPPLLPGSDMEGMQIMRLLVERHSVSGFFFVLICSKIRTTQFYADHVTGIVLWGWRREQNQGK